MGLTSVSLGHAYGPVLERVKAELDRGANFQRPSVLELETAERFLSLVPDGEAAARIRALTAELRQRLN